MTHTIQLRQLTLVPHPLASIPAPSSPDFDAFVAILRAEAELIFDHASWSSPKLWHGGLVETFSLPHEAVVAIPREGEAVEEVVHKKGFWGGGSAKDKDGGIGWHMRRTRQTAQRSATHFGFGFEAYWETLGERHIEQEVEYLPLLAQVLPVGDNGTYLKQYNLPFPTANRSFLSCAIVLSTTPSSSTRPSSPTSRPLRSFLVFTLPVFDPSNSMEHEDKGHVRGRYTAVEEVREVETEEGRVIEWRCASMSTPGGSIPTRLAESHMASSMATNVPEYFAWLSKRYATVDRPTPHHKRLSLDGLHRKGSHKSHKGDA